jgi:hypothetical protein
MPAERPIVFFPGVMGSRLYFPAADRFWDPDSTRRMLWWAPAWPVRRDDDNRRDMHVNQPAGVVVTPLDNQVADDEARRGWGGVVWSYYSGILRDLQRSYPAAGVYAVGYDWRQRIEWLGWYAGQRIRKALAENGAAEFSAVTHSMGGLVLRAAFAADPSLLGIARRVVHVCQPSAGAVILYRRLFTGLVRPYDGGGGVADRAFRLILGNTRTAFLGNMSGLPGPMQLLPSPYFGAAWNPLLAAGAAYTSGNAAPAIGDGRLAAEVAADLAARVNEVNAFHVWLGPPANPALAARTWLLYGATSPTETAVTYPAGRATPTVTPAGDEVVPAVSATALGLPAGQAIGFGGLTHPVACNNPGVIAAVGAIPL